MFLPGAARLPPDVPGSKLTAIMQILAKVENDTIRLPAGVHLPDGTSVRVEVDADAEAEAKAAAEAAWVESPEGGGWPKEYFARTFGALEGEPLERPAQGMVGWLLACPEKDWFQAVDSEATDTL